MQKIIMGIFLATQLYAIEYELLLEEAINNNSSLQLIQSQKEQIGLEGKISTRYENPNLELEVADFSVQFIRKKNEFGGRVGVSQSIPLPHIIKDKELITQIKQSLVQEEYSLEKSKFIYLFNLKYLAYKKASAKVELQEQSLRVSQEVLDTVRSRYTVGAVAKSDQLEVQLDYKQMQSKLYSLEIEREVAKAKLLSFSKVSTQSIELKHQFFIKNTTQLHPMLRLNQAKIELSQSKIELLKHSVDSVELFSELEHEPDQDVFRVGLSIALPTFNTNSEEKQLEKIKIANQQLKISSYKKGLTLDILQLKEENSKLKELIQSYQLLIDEEEELFNMYQQSYAVAKVNLLKLQQSRIKKIGTQEKILEINFAIEKNNITINYLQGDQNE